MTDSLTPALTPLDWANLREGHEKPLHSDMGVSLWGDGICLHTDNLYTEIAAEGDRHALAALCLYQQQFGFSSEDVELLRNTHRVPYAEFADRLEALASRISALLPPTP